MTTEKINRRYEKKKNKISEDTAIKWIAEDIVMYLIKNRKSRIDILICTYASEDDFWRDCTLNSTVPYFLKRKKTRMAFYKFTKTIEFQEKVIDKLKMNRMVDVVEEDEEISSWQKINNYKKAVVVKYKTR